MPHLTPDQIKPAYDVIVVGSGASASGGQAAYTPTMEGAKVLMLEAGRTGFDSLAGRAGYAYGKQFKDDARRYYGSTQGFTAQGAMVPNEDCYSELDPTVTAEVLRHIGLA